MRLQQRRKKKKKQRRKKEARKKKSWGVGDEKAELQSPSLGAQAFF
jgi:hypothetical protein